MFTVLLISKSTRRVVGKYGTYKEERQAERECEAWGWNFDDGKGNSYCMDYEEGERPDLKEL